jgi:hypothetical protein
LFSINEQQIFSLTNVINIDILNIITDHLFFQKDIL